MEHFFDFWPDIPKNMAFPSFGAAHISSLAFIGIIIAFSLLKMKKYDIHKNEKIIKYTALILPLLEITRIAWLMHTGETRFVKLLPLHLCSMQVYFIPIAVLSDIKGMKELIYCTGLLGGVCGIVFPVGVSNTYPFFHYQTIETLIFHSILIFIPLALIMHTEFRPQIKYFPRMLAIFALTAAAAAIVDFGFGQNYMFLAEPPVGTPFQWIFENWGRTAYWILFFSFGCILSLCMLIPFIRKKQP